MNAIIDVDLTALSFRENPYRRMPGCVRERRRAGSSGRTSRLFGWPRGMKTQ